jgi:serine protease Do
MTKKSILAAVFLIFLGIIFGVVLVSNFQGTIEKGFAGRSDVQIGAATPIQNPNAKSKELSRAFIDVSKAVTPTVVTVNVTTKAKGRSQDMNEFFHFFGPDFQFPDPQPQQGSGSGVIISPDGYILTNNHVVENASDNGIEVIFNDRRRLRAKVVGTDPSTDCAIIKVDAKDLPTAAFGNSDALEVGEWVIAVGNPLGLNSTVTAGIISAIGRGQIGVIRDTYGIENFIQTDAAINPGNSGGPLVNLSGEVVGINTAIATTNARYQGYGFAIPINLARTVAEDLIKHGKVRRGYIGVSIQGVDETTAKALGLGNARGVLVQSLVDGGAASRAGVKEGDVILSIDGRDVNQANELQSYVAGKHPGDEVSLKIYRDGKTIERKLALQSRREEAVTASDRDSESSEREPEREPRSKAITLQNLGMSVRSLSSAEKKESEVDHGIVVSGVERFGEAYNRGIREGTVILEADKTPISSPGEFKALVEKRKPGDALLLRVKRGDGTTGYLAVEVPK